MNNYAQHLCEAMAGALDAHPGSKDISISRERDYALEEPGLQNVLRVAAQTDAECAAIAALLGAPPPQYTEGPGARWLYTSSTTADRAMRVVVTGPLHRVELAIDEARAAAALTAIGAALTSGEDPAS